MTEDTSIEESTDDRANRTRYRVREDRPAITYGPTETDGEWVLSVSATEGRVEIVVPEEPMYELWTEVRGVPWPFPAHHSEEKARLVRQLVHRANGADEEMLRNALRAMGVRE